MAVKINTATGKAETPTDLVQKAQVETMTIVDAKNRQITVGRFSALHYYRLTKVLGGNTASNAASLDLATVVCCVRKIDDEDIPMPATEKEIEMLLQRLDFEGLAAVGQAMAKLNGVEDDQNKNLDAQTEISKN